MDSLISKQNETIDKFKQLRNFNGEEFRKKLLEIFDENELEYLLNKVSYNKIPVIQHELFTSKKELALSFWNETLSKTKNKEELNVNYAAIIPSKILLAGDKINKFTNKLLSNKSFNSEEIDDLINTYKKLFECVLKLLEPYFKVILNKKVHIEWSDISKETENYNTDCERLFCSMNGNLRNAIAHESNYIEDNTFIWFQNDGFQKEYDTQKVVNKTVDLFFLILVLHYGLNETQIKNIIKCYKTTDVDKLKKAFNAIEV